MNARPLPYQGERIGAFLSIPKNASKTVLRVLDLGPDRDLETTNSLVIYESHQRGCVLAKRHCLDDLFVFCFCRNPYDRCVSWYTYHRERGKAPYRQFSFDTWVRRGLPHHWQQQNATNYYQEGITPLLQYNFVDKCRVDFVGRIEHFSRDLNEIIERLNHLCRERKIGHRFAFSNLQLNTSQRTGNVDDYYCTETREIVYRLFQSDFTYFGYEA